MVLNGCIFWYTKPLKESNRKKIPFLPSDQKMHVDIFSSNQFYHWNNQAKGSRNRFPYVTRVSYSNICPYFHSPYLICLSIEASTER